LNEKKLGVIFIVLFVSSVIIISNSYLSFNSVKKTNERLLNQSKELEENSKSLEQNLSYKNTKIEQWKKGSNYVLHDPFYSEALSYLNSSTDKSSDEVINQAKNEGIRCALVLIRVVKESITYELIAFDTIDKGMKYFEIGTNYKVVPRINESYVDCVINHYSFNLYNDTITDIITIW